MSCNCLSTTCNCLCLVAACNSLATALQLSNNCLTTACVCLPSKLLPNSSLNVFLNLNCCKQKDRDDEGHFELFLRTLVGTQWLGILNFRRQDRSLYWYLLNLNPSCAPTTNLTVSIPYDHCILEYIYIEFQIRLKNRYLTQPSGSPSRS